MIDKLDDLIGSISSCLAGEKAYYLPKVCQRYSLDDGEESEAYQSKYKYVINRLKNKKETFILDLAKKLIIDYQSYRIGNSLNKYLDFQFYKLTEITRNELVEKIKSLERICGNLDSIEFLLKAGLSDFVQTNSFDFFPLETEEKDPILDLLNGRMLYEILDFHFFTFLEKLVHPVIRNEQDVEMYLKVINPILAKDDFELVQFSFVSGRPIYKVMQTNGVKGVVKNLIFA